MGAFYESILVKAEANDLVRKVLEELVSETGASFYLGPALAGWVSVFPESGADGGAIALKLAEVARTDVFYLTVHDDDFFTYDFFRSGERTDSYHSCPGYFETGDADEEEERPGNPEVFQDLLGTPGNLERLKRLLAAEGEKYSFASARLEEFAELLGLKNAVGSYDYMAAGETDGLEAVDQFIHLKGAGIKPVAAPHTAQDYFDMGRVMRSEGRLTVALALLDQAIQMDPTLALAYNSRGLVKADTGDVPGALADYDRAIELKPDLAVAYTNRGELKRKQGDEAGAWADYNRALEVDPQNGAAYNHRAQMKRARGDLAGALVDFDRAVELSPDWVAIRNNRGELKRSMGDLPGALADFSRAVELDPENASAFSNRGLVRQQTGDLAGALADFNRSLEIKPLAVAYNNRAILMHAKGDLAAALADLDRAIQLKPDEGEFLRNRSHIRTMRGDLVGGLEDAQRAVKARPTWAEAYSLLGEIQRRRNELDEAMANFEKAIELQPTNGGAYNGRGLVRKAKGDLNGALADLDRAVELLPTAAMPRSNRGVVWQALGDFKRAEADYQKALELKPDFAEAKKHLASLFDAVLKKGLAEAEAAAPKSKEPKSDLPATPIVRTDFSNQRRWKSLGAAATKPDDDFGFVANVELVDDKQHEGWTVAQVMKLYAGHADLAAVFIADATAIETKGYPILVVDLREEPGRTFRVMAKDLWSVENNLSIGNMGFSEFVEQAGEGGIFRPTEGGGDL